MSQWQKDLDEIMSHRFDQGADYWSTKDAKVLKGGPFSTVECAHYLVELGIPLHDEILTNIAQLLFQGAKQDGRFKIAPTGGIYPCHTAIVANALCYLGYANDPRIQKTRDYFLETQQEDGGWKCNKYSFGRGPETEYSTPQTTLTVLDLFRFSDNINFVSKLDKAVEFLLQHWVIKKPISPCHYGIGTLFKQVEYPFRGYNLFYYVYVLSFYSKAQKDLRFLEALALLQSKTVDGQIVIERVVPKLAMLSFCQKGKPSDLATQRYLEILQNLK